MSHPSAFSLQTHTRVAPAKKGLQAGRLVPPCEGSSRPCIGLEYFSLAWVRSTQPLIGHLKSQAVLSGDMHPLLKSFCSGRSGIFWNVIFYRVQAVTEWFDEHGNTMSHMLWVTQPSDLTPSDLSTSGQFWSSS